MDLDPKAELAKEVLEIVPASMNGIRVAMRSLMGDDLSVPQFRILAAIHRGIDRVSDISRHHGVSPASMSKMVNNLVERKLVKRTSVPNDRRQARLELTKGGEAYFGKIRRKAERVLHRRLAGMDPSRSIALRAGLDVLRGLFDSIDEEFR